MKRGTGSNQIKREWDGDSRLVTVKRTFCSSSRSLQTTSVRMRHAHGCLRLRFRDVRKGVYNEWGTDPNTKDENC